MNDRCYEAAAERVFNAQDEALFEVWHEFLEAMKRPKKKRGHQKWTVVSKNKIFSIWNSFAKFGFVRDEEALDDLANQFIENIGRLYANTVLAGHTEEKPLNALSNAEIEIEEEKLEALLEEFYDYIYIPEERQYRISDYAFKKLHESVIEYFCADTAEKKLVALDHLINVIHQRTDLAKSFIEGGRETLSKLSGVEDSNVRSNPSLEVRAEKILREVAR